MSADSSSQQEWQDYTIRDDFKDVVPIPIDDEPNSICPIAYSEEFKITMSYLRAFLKENEISERAYEVVGHAIILNPGNFTAWLYRYQLFGALGKDVFEELDWISDIAEDVPKNYQLWYQRQKIVSNLIETKQIEKYNLDAGSKEGTVPGEGNLPSHDFQNAIIASEIQFTNKQLANDTKNFHAWAYRQYIIKSFELWEYEMKFTCEKIMNDIRNNSAWNQKYFVLTRGNSSEKITDKGVLSSEISYALEKISIAPNNESSWVYIQGLLRNHCPEMLYNDFYESIEELKKAAPFKSTIELCRFYWKYIYDRYVYFDTNQSHPQYEQLHNEWFEQAVYACEFLSEKLDPIRKNYYLYLKSKITK
ncbi:hypothetical protein BB560_003966 [Smittium megazygosporum]|uniref:Protein farnesyltransferase/geranylgeranyltransferase type-1 subunit alpha n=1 Tax=Smittium megazygosporum TaxID=133381 RepID=A0A2T9ZAJ6_9FUNG|nr:hypothetical protein BB560_003966 [Smittium megazygosporum]